MGAKINEGVWGPETEVCLGTQSASTIKGFSETFGLIWGGFFYIEKRSAFLPKCFFQAIKQQNHAILLPLPQLHGWLQHPKTLRGEKQPAQGTSEDYL